MMIVTEEDYDRAGRLAQQRQSLVEFFRVVAGKPLDMRRKRDRTRSIKW
jgi:hypothetical protein